MYLTLTKAQFDSSRRSTCLFSDRLQPLDLSVSKPAKDFLRRKFSSLYATQIQPQLSVGKSAAEVQVDMKMSVLKEVSAAWLTGLYDYLCSQPDISKNGFTKAGIEEALTDPVASLQED